MNAMGREFNILGQKIVIKDQAEADLASVAIQIVNEKLAEIQASKPLLGPQQVAVLALLEIAGNLVKDRSAIDHYRAELDQKCTSLMKEISGVQSELDRPSA
jgi:cell division protein ZapA (FtsZ GTPase activity inhibitor)